VTNRNQDQAGKYKALLDTPGPRGVDELSALSVDYYYDPANWEVTHNAGDLFFAKEWLDEAADGEPMQIATLIEGPTLYAVLMPITMSSGGEVEDTEIRFFSTAEDARAAIAKASAHHASEGGE
jgi:hypothetical protein